MLPPLPRPIAVGCAASERGFAVADCEAVCLQPAALVGLRPVAGISNGILAAAQLGTKLDSQPGLDLESEVCSYGYTPCEPLPRNDLSLCPQAFGFNGVDG
jgi:hypothetical protein